MNQLTAVNCREAAGKNNLKILCAR